MNTIALEADILAAGGYDPELANRVVEHERGQIAARGVTDPAAVAELAEITLANAESRRVAISAIKEREPDKFVDVRRVPKQQRSDPNALRKEAFRQRERDAQLQKATTRAMASIGSNRSVVPRYR